MKNISLAFLLCSLSVAAGAQTPYLVKDINVSSSQVTASSQPHDFFAYGSKVLFTTRASSSTAELWSTDGTEAGTERIARIPNGNAGVAPSRFTLVNGKVLFNALDAQGFELWVTDGSSAGTKLMADIWSGSGSSAPGDRIVYHGKMLFAANDGVDGNELWITDGTPAGTRFFADLNPGPRGSDPRSFVVFNDTVYFAANDVLWKSDGTEGGTVRVNEQAAISNLLVAGSRLFFIGYRPDVGHTLWVSDGTDAGTHSVTQPGSPEISYASLLTAFGARVLFLASDKEHGGELWISDGTAAGTHIVKDVVPGSSGSFGYASEISAAGDVALFSTLDLNNEEIWRTDGTEEGTALVHRFGVVPSGSSARSFVVAGNRFYFAGYGGAFPVLWVSDGTPAGTHPVKNTGLTLPFVSPAGYAERILTNINGIIYFSGANSLNGFEPWRSDGTEAGTFMIKNVNPDQAPSSSPDHLTAAGDWLYFDAWDGLSPSTQNSQSRSLWRTDGTPSGTLKLTDTQQTAYVPFGHTIFFDKNDPWTSDGTPEGTAPANELAARFAGRVTILFVMGDKLFVSVPEKTTLRPKLWLTTAAPGAPVMPVDVTYPLTFVEVAGRVMFFGDQGLWLSDGTAAGTRRVAGTGMAATPGVIMSGLYFFTTPDNIGSRLWKSDGTFEGTELIKIFPQTVDHLVACDHRVFFTTNGQLWTSDGTEAGTVALPAKTSDVAATIDRAVFSVSDSGGAPEPWTSDGTPEGTHLLREIYPGAFGSYPANLAGIDGQVYFSATDDLHGTETWVTDGTPEGTRLAADVEPGVAPSYPEQYVRSGQRLFFTARTAAEGEELWGMPLPPALRIDDTHVAEGADGARTTARFTVSLTAASAQVVTASYTTSDGSAHSGSDYEATSGTITFSPGETSKSIEVRVPGDAVSEPTEIFFVKLSNPAGVVVAKRTGAAIIDDDDQVADLALSLDFSNFTSAVVARATNNGPRAATQIAVQQTITPADQAESRCTTCSDLHELRAGATVQALRTQASVQQKQLYITATATGVERDPNLSDNTVAWTTHERLAMDSLYLTPGSQANVWVAPLPNMSLVSVESSNPSVLAVPANVPIPVPDKAFSFSVRGLSVGSATIRVFAPSSPTTVGTLNIEVVPAGTRPRWQSNFFAYVSTLLKFGPAIVAVDLTGAAPFTGEHPTGQITVTSNGRELARAAATGGGHQNIEASLPEVGRYPITIAYSGDANFLPATMTYDVSVGRGDTTLTAWAEKKGSNVIIHATVTGSPMANPTGLISIAESAVVIPHTDTPLKAGPAGTATADVTLTNVSTGTHTFIVEYQGDTRYLYSYQNVRVGDGRRAVKH